jgi:hypothetical protein
MFEDLRHRHANARVKLVGQTRHKQRHVKLHKLPELTETLRKSTGADIMPAGT